MAGRRWSRAASHRSGRASEHVVHPDQEPPAGDHPDRDKGPNQDREQKEEEPLAPSQVCWFACPHEVLVRWPKRSVGESGVPVFALTQRQRAKWLIYARACPLTARLCSTLSSSKGSMPHHLTLS